MPEFDFPEGMTPLQMAIYEGEKTSVITALLKTCDVNSADGGGETALDWALRNSWGVAKLRRLLNRGALVMGEGPNPRNALNTYLSCQWAGRLNLHVVRLLLERDPNAVHWKDHRGESLLHLALHRRILFPKRRSLPVLKLLLAAGARINARDNHGNTPLASYLAQTNGRTVSRIVVRFLVDHGSDLASKDVYGQTVLSKARKVGVVLGEQRI